MASTPKEPVVSANGDENRKVLIIGAGTTGLALAQGLKKAGVKYIVYEMNKSEDINRNWSMGVHWGIPILQQLLPPELFATIASRQVDPNWELTPSDRLRMINGATGELLKEIDSSAVYRLRRDKFRNMLLHGIDVRWDKTLVKIDLSADGQTVTACFADGTSDTGNFLVGCDGPHSSVRTWLFGEEAAKVLPLDYASTMCYTKHTKEHALFLRSAPHHPLYQTGVHPNGSFAWLSVHDAEGPNDPESWIFFHYISVKEPKEYINTMTNRELVAFSKKMAKEYVDPWKSVFEWMDDDAPVSYGKLRQWDPRDHEWNNRQGRVTLGGDAAHPMTFQRGQGVNHALKDAWELCKTIEYYWKSDGLSMSRENGVTRYKAEMKARGGEEVRLSEGNVYAVHDFEQVVKSALWKSGMHQGN